MKSTIKRPAAFDNDTLASIRKYNQERFESMGDDQARVDRMIAIVFLIVLAAVVLSMIGSFVWFLAR